MGILALIFAVMVVTCPKTEDHRDAVRKELAKYIYSHINKKDTGVFDVFNNLFTNQISEMRSTTCSALTTTPYAP